MNCCDFKMFYVTAMVTTKKIIIKYTQMEMRIKQRHTLQKKLMKPNKGNKEGKDGQKSYKTYRKQNGNSNSFHISN